MGAADRGAQACIRRPAGRDWLTRLCRARGGAGGEAQPLGPPAFDPAPQQSLRGGRDNAEAWTPAPHDRDIDGEFVPPGNELARAVERIDQNEAVGKAV